MTSWKVAASFSARPPETMILALVSSGRSDLASSLPTKLLDTRVGGAGHSLDVPEPPSLAALSNAVPRTVMTSLGSLLSTVAIALPA